eukprot:358352-Chlamydomonas_euryale.AAC.1
MLDGARCCVAQRAPCDNSCAGLVRTLTSGAPRPLGNALRSWAPLRGGVASHIISRVTRVDQDISELTSCRQVAYVHRALMVCRHVAPEGGLCLFSVSPAAQVFWGHVWQPSVSAQSGVEGGQMEVSCSVCAWKRCAEDSRAE